MTLLEIVILAHRCRSTHHFIAFDALQLLDGPDGEDWKNLLLRHHEQLLKGAKAPDSEFKDFQNHVLHVQEGEWGGARDAAMLWYGKAVEALRNQKWGDAAYALGVLTHYYADPIQPFHTGQTEEEGAIHRALEWSIACSRDTIKALIDAKGYPRLSAGHETGFVADMVLAGAKYSNPYYRTFIDHYDIDRGVIDPPSGLDEHLLEVIADLIAYATSGVALLFQRAFAESGVKPKKVDLDLPGYLAALDIPIRKLTKRIADAQERKIVERMYAELLETGKVINTLSEDDRKIRALHAKQVLRRPLEQLDAQPLGPLGKKHKPVSAHKKAVKYELKVVPVPADDAPKPTISITPQIPAPITAAAPAPIHVEAEKTSDPGTEDVLFDADHDAAERPVPAPEEAAPQIQAAQIVPPKATEPEPDTTSANEPESVVQAAKSEPDPESEADTLAEPEIIAETAIEAEPSKPEKTAAEAVLEEMDAAEAAEQDNPAAKAETHKEYPAPKLVADATDDDEDDTPEVKVSGPGLTLESPVVDAPSIGPKTAARLAKVDIRTIGDLLAADPEETAAALNVRYIKAPTLIDWQDQTRLMVEAPGLRVLDSQILVGAGIRSAEDLANASATKVLKAATSFLDTPQGARVLWGGENTVDKGEIEQWIGYAKEAGR